MSKWKSPEIIVGMIGLMLSLTANLMQCRQNIKSDRKATEESIRANNAAARANELQMQKQQWLNSLKAELSTVEKAIEAEEYNNVVAETNSNSPDYDERTNSGVVRSSINARLTELNFQKGVIKRQINELISLSQ